MWEVFDQICLPTLLLKGAESSILKKELANEMTERGPKPKLVEFQNVGHAPYCENAKLFNNEIENFLQ